MSHLCSASCRTASSLHTFKSPAASLRAVPCHACQCRPPPKTRAITCVRMLRAAAHRHAPGVEDWESRMEVQSLHIRAVPPQHRDGIRTRFAHCGDQQNTQVAADCFTIRPQGTAHWSYLRQLIYGIVKYTFLRVLKRRLNQLPGVTREVPSPVHDAIAAQDTAADLLAKHAYRGLRAPASPHTRSPPSMGRSRD